MISSIPGLIILSLLGRHLTISIVKSGLILGFVLYGGVFTSTWALYFTSATDTGFYPALNGVIASGISWIIYKLRPSKLTAIAAMLSLLGVALLFSQSHSKSYSLSGEIIALGAAFIYTVYIFLAERETVDSGISIWLIFALELLTMAFCSIIVLIATHHTFSNSYNQLVPIKWLVIYAGIATTFVPTAISIFFQKYISAVTVAYLYVLEPVWGALIAHFWIGESITNIAYVGGVFILSGSFIKSFANDNNDVNLEKSLNK